MTNPTLKNFGLTGVQLARLTGQDQKTISRKVRGNQGLSLGAREAGILACFSVMTIEQKAFVGAVFQQILADLSDQ